MSAPTPQWQLRQVVKTLERLASEQVDRRYAATLQSHADGLAQIAKTITPAARPEMLTPAQARVLAFIQEHIDQHERPPTRKEIAEAFSFASANAAEWHIRALERKGVITVTGGARGIRVNQRSTHLIEGTL